MVLDLLRRHEAYVSSTYGSSCLRFELDVAVNSDASTTVSVFRTVA